MKFNKFVELKKVATILAEDGAYKENMSKAQLIKEELENFYVNELEDYTVHLLEEESEEDTFEDSIDESDDINEASSQEGLKSSKNVLARIFRWRATLAAKKRISNAFKKYLAALASIQANEIKLKIKLEEIGRISGPEAKAKKEEISGMLEKVKLGREKIEQEKADKMIKIKDPGILRAGGAFGLNIDVLDRYIGMQNTTMKIKLADMRIQQAQKILTDNEMKNLKDSIKSLNARETKYEQELKNTEQAIQNDIEKEEMSGADASIKKEADQLQKEIDKIDENMAALRERMADADDDVKRNLDKEYKELKADRESKEKKYQGLAKKAKKAILGSASKEEE